MRTTRRSGASQGRAGGARSYRLAASRVGAPPRPSTLVLTFGVLLVVFGLGTAGYARFLDWQHQVQQPVGPGEVLTASIEPLPAGPGRGAAAPSVPAAVPPQDPAGRPTWIMIPRIGVDTSVMEVGIQNGEYQVASFDVGHHADSVNPGAPGNSVYNGHLETIDAGRVFARLKELAVGDAVYLYTRTERYAWVVDTVRTVPNTESSFVAPTPDTRITLYTCDGTFDPRSGDYTHRRVVVGKLVQVTPRA